MHSSDLDSQAGGFNALAVPGLSPRCGSGSSLRGLFVAGTLFRVPKELSTDLLAQRAFAIFVADGAHQLKILRCPVRLGRLPTSWDTRIWKELTSPEGIPSRYQSQSLGTSGERFKRAKKKAPKTAFQGIRPMGLDSNQNGGQNCEKDASCEERGSCHKSAPLL